MDPETAATRVESFFADLHRDVFAGDPVANTSLQVEVVEARSVADGILVAVIAPWTIAGILFFDNDTFPDALTIDGRPLPVLINEVPSLGRYGSVTLVSEVDAIASQEEARARVAAVIEPFVAAVAAAGDSATIDNPSRRDLLRTLTRVIEPPGGPNGSMKTGGPVVDPG